MTRNPASCLAAITVAAATISAGLVSSSAAFGDEITAPQTPLHAGSPTVAAALRLHEMSADALKRGYLACDRVIAQNLPDSATFIVCEAVYEELRGRVFGGDLDALITWVRAAWQAGAEPR